MEGPLIAIPDPFTGRADVARATEELARMLGEPQILPADVAQVRAALHGRPVVISSECVVALAMLPWLAQERPGTRVLWLDAHPDFNTPDTSPSGYAGGMPVAGATGLWDAGVEPPFPAADVVFAGIRDVDPGEQMLLDGAGATVLRDVHEAPAALAGAGPVFVHLDCDVVDGYPAAFPVPGGPRPEEVRDVLAEVAAQHEIAGVSVAAVAGPPDVPAAILEPLLSALSQDPSA